MRPALLRRMFVASMLVFSVARGQDAGRAAIIRRVSGSVKAQRDIAFARRPSRVLKLDIYYPAKKSGLAPAIMYISGAAWKVENRHIQTDFSQLSSAPLPDLFPLIMTTFGYAVVSPDYRASNEAQYPAAAVDLTCAVKWLGAHARAFGIDADRIGLMSGSAPAHLAALVATAGAKHVYDDPACFPNESFQIRAVYAFAGFFDFGYYRQVPGNQTLAKQIAEFLGGPYEQVRANYEEGSVTRYVDASTPPFLLVHGLQDMRVPFEQSLHFARALQERNIPVRLVAINNYEHGPIAGRVPDPPFDLVDDQVYAFFGKYLKHRRVTSLSTH